VCLEEGRVNGRKVGTNYPADRHDHHAAGAGPAQRGRRALGAGAADIGVIEQQGPAAARGGWCRRCDGAGPDCESAFVGTHVADGSRRTPQQLRCPARTGEGCVHRVRQALERGERRAAGAGGRGDGEHAVDGTARCGSNTRTVLRQELGQESAHKTGEVPARLVDR
jgi:hypothetical protein